MVFALTGCMRLTVVAVLLQVLPVLAGGVAPAGAAAFNRVPSGSSPCQAEVLAATWASSLPADNGAPKISTAVASTHCSNSKCSRGLRSRPWLLTRV